MSFISEKNRTALPKRSHPLLGLGDEDLDLVMELVLQSGSLKGVAASYGVSYPTIRVRVNRLIGRLEEVLAGRPLDPLRELLARLVERGEMAAGTARAIVDAAGPREEAR